MAKMKIQTSNKPEIPDSSNRSQLPSNPRQFDSGKYLTSVYGKCLLTQRINMENTNQSIMDYDFDVIDQVALKSSEIKPKHIYQPDDRVPPQGSPFLKSVTTIKNVAKNHYKKLW